MPAKSERQRKFMGSELARNRAGKRTKTGMSESDLEDFARSEHSRTARKPNRKKKKRK